MKFLIFNIAVAAALIFLFTADKSDLQNAVTQAHEAAGEVKKIARKIAGDVAEKAPVVDIPKPVATPPPATRIAKALTADAPPPMPPEVAKRRAEILSGFGADAGMPVLKQNETLMTPSERRRELLSLAEEMELLYAQSLGQ